MPEKQAEPERINWEGADLRGVNMAGVNLEGADLWASDLRGTNFTGTNLRYADLRGASVDGANFQNASLYGAKSRASKHACGFSRGRHAAGQSRRRYDRRGDDAASCGRFAANLAQRDREGQPAKTGGARSGHE